MEDYWPDPDFVGSRMMMPWLCCSVPRHHQHNRFQRAFSGALRVGTHWRSCLRSVQGLFRSVPDCHSVQGLFHSVPDLFHFVVPDLFHFVVPDCHSLQGLFHSVQGLFHSVQQRLFRSRSGVRSAVQQGLFPSVPSLLGGSGQEAMHHLLAQLLERS